MTDDEFDEATDRIADLLQVVEQGIGGGPNDETTWTVIGAPRQQHLWPSYDTLGFASLLVDRVLRTQTGAEPR